MSGEQTDRSALRDTEAHLVHGLIGERHRIQYTMSAAFRMSIDTLVKLLPSWVDGLSAEADKFDEARNERLRHMLGGFDAAPYSQGGPS